MELLLILSMAGLALFNNRIFWPCVFAWLAAQLLKMLINLIVEKKFVLSRLWGDGGMPSGHSATVAALAAMCGYGYGFHTAWFGVTMILMIIVTHDAVGVRREAGKHAVTIKLIADTINHLVTNKDEKIRTGKLKEFIGHTPLQVFFGCAVGVAVVAIYCAINGIYYGELYREEFLSFLKNEEILEMLRQNVAA